MGASGLLLPPQVLFYNANIMKTKYLFLSLLFVAGLSMSCAHHNGDEGHEGHHHDGDEHDDHGEHEGHEEKLGPDDVHFSDAQAEAVGLTVDTIRPSASFRPTILCSGVIESQTVGSVTIVAPQSGIVSMSDRGIAPGSYLQRGQSLAVISGKVMQDGDAAQLARIEYEAAKDEMERAQRLVADKIVSQKEYNEAKARYEAANAAYEALRSRMTAGGVAVNAPAAGHVVRMMVEQGQYVAAGQPIAVIERCGSKRLRVDVPERHFTQLRKVSSANFRTSASDRLFRLSDMNGRLVSVGVSVSDGGSTVPVTFDFDDEGEALLAGSAANVYLILDGSRGKETITVSQDAIIESQGLMFVYVRDADDHDVYHRREVRIGLTDGESTEILSGISAGDIVVEGGAHRLHLAGASKAIPAHTHNH